MDKNLPYLLAQDYQIIYDQKDVSPKENIHQRKQFFVLI